MLCWAMDTRHQRSCYTKFWAKWMYRMEIRQWLLGGWVKVLRRGALAGVQLGGGVWAITGCLWRCMLQMCSFSCWKLDLNLKIGRDIYKIPLFWKPVTLFRNIYPWVCLKCKHLLNTCTPMFIAALFIIARTWKQPRCPSADKWIRKLWYIYTMEYYSAIKKNSFESVLMRWMKLEPIIHSEVSQKDKDQYSILTYIWNLKRW